MPLPSREEISPRLEQRAHVRVPAVGAATLTQGEQCAAGVVRNVSAHGAFIATSFSLKPGAEVTVDLALGGAHRVSGRATVRWVRPRIDRNPDVEAGVGIEFAPTETEAFAAMADFVRDRLERLGFSHPFSSPPH